jgi:antitoxin component YwqK of YwqJK toxin-antitoxin module
MPIKPLVTWEQFCRSAPYFFDVVYEAVHERSDIVELTPLLRAAFYFSVFDGQVSNGGISQYFYNAAHILPNFEQAPNYIGVHPAFQPIIHIVKVAHEAWGDCASEFESTRERREFPDKLFQRYAPIFEEIQTEYFQLHKDVIQRFFQAFVREPEAYFTMQPMPDVPSIGRANVSTNDGKSHFRFLDAFPIGPNVFESEIGRRDMIVRFGQDRTLLECSDNVWHYWIHYPSQRSFRTSFNGAHLNSLAIERSFQPMQHGIQEYFDEHGNIRSSSVYQFGEEIASDQYHANGQRKLNITANGDHSICSSYWPNGALNCRSLWKGHLSALVRYLECHSESGENLAPNGTGKFVRFNQEKNGLRYWGEGELLDGNVVGDIKEYQKNLATGEVVAKLRYEKNVTTGELVEMNDPRYISPY